MTCVVQNCIVLRIEAERSIIQRQARSKNKPIPLGFVTTRARLLFFFLTSKIGMANHMTKKDNRSIVYSLESIV